MDTSHFHDYSVSAANYDDVDISDDETKKDPLATFSHQILTNHLCLPDELQVRV